MKARYFDAHFAQATVTLNFNPEWCNGTGYFDHAVTLVKLNPGDMAKAEDPQGRKLIFIGTRFGTCVFFERYARKELDDQIRVVSNVPSELRMLVTDGALGYDEFARMASNGANIGTAVERMFNIMNDKAAKRRKADEQERVVGNPAAEIARGQAKMASSAAAVKYHLDKPDRSQQTGFKLN